MTLKQNGMAAPARLGEALEHAGRRLRPAKVHAGLRRRWFELALERTRLHPAGEVVEVGNEVYGGWRIPVGPIEPDWVCYCVGAGGDISFDLELIRRWGVSVRAFEPVPRYVERARETAAGEPRFAIYQAAVTTADGPIRMQLTHDSQSESVSSAGLYESSSFVELDGRSLPSLMSEIGDDHIDLLKLDVEGSEYELLPTLDLRALGVKVFAVQLHHTGTVRQAKALISDLAEQGYDAVACRPAVKLAFARRDLHQR